MCYSIKTKLFLTYKPKDKPSGTGHKNETDRENLMHQHKATSTGGSRFSKRRRGDNETAVGKDRPPRGTSHSSATSSRWHLPLDGIDWNKWRQYAGKNSVTCLLLVLHSSHLLKCLLMLSILIFYEMKVLQCNWLN